LFDRVRGGVRLTTAGKVLLRQGAIALDALDEAQRELTGATVDVQRIRLGVFAAAGSALLPRALSRLRRQRPDIEVTSREGSTPALIRALRAGTIDLAILTSRVPHRSPDQEDPPLHLETLLDVRLALAVPLHGKFGGRASITAAEVTDEPWIASPSSTGEPLLGVWPGLPGRPHVHHTCRDWLTKLELVAAGAGITTVPGGVLPDVPGGVHITHLEGVPEEMRRVSLARLPGPGSEAAAAVSDILRDAAGQLRQS
jgi:DNA-binding transcriptional LysR family regulator